MSVQVRAIQPADEATWRDMWHQYNEFYHRVDSISDEVTTTTFKRFLDPNTRIYGAVAVDGDKPIGFVHWYPHPSTSSLGEVVYLHDLFVDPNVRNKGTGRALIEHVYKDAKENLKADAVYWHTQYFNHRAQLLYTKVASRTDFVMYHKAL